MTRYVGRFAYDEGSQRFRFLEGLVDEREPVYAHYFFYGEVLYTEAICNYLEIIHVCQFVSVLEISVACELYYKRLSKVLPQ